MSTYITLEVAKTHLRVDFTDDDTYIQSLCDLVEQVVASEIGSDLADIEVESVLPLALTHSMLLMVGHFYMIREPVIIGVSINKVPYAFEFLLAPFKTWTIA